MTSTQIRTFHDENDINSQNQIPNTRRTSSTSSSSPSKHHSSSSSSNTHTTTTNKRSSSPPQPTTTTDRQRQSSVESDASSIGGHSEKMDESSLILVDEQKEREEEKQQPTRSTRSTPSPNTSMQIHTPASILESSATDPPSSSSSSSSSHPHTSIPRTSLVYLAHFLERKMNSVLSFLTIGQVLMCFPVCQDLNRACQRYFASMEYLDLSQFWGVIGSTQADSHFYNSFLPKCRNVRRICLSYCTQMKSSHLDRILHKLCESSSAVSSSHADGSSSTTSHPDLKNERITELNLYYCKKLGAQATFKIAARCPNLEVLNMGRCHMITSHENINGLRALAGLRSLRELAISLNTDLERNDVIEIVSLLIYDESFLSLTVLDLRVGCRLLTHSKDIDLDDLEERGVTILGLPVGVGGRDQRGRP